MAGVGLQSGVGSSERVVKPLSNSGVKFRNVSDFLILLDY